MLTGNKVAIDTKSRFHTVSLTRFPSQNLLKIQIQSIDGRIAMREFYAFMKVTLALYALYLSDICSRWMNHSWLRCRQQCMRWFGTCNIVAIDANFSLSSFWIFHSRLFPYYSNIHLALECGNFVRDSYTHSREKDMIGVVSKGGEMFKNSRNYLLYVEEIYTYERGEGGTLKHYISRGYMDMFTLFLFALRVLHYSAAFFFCVFGREKK